MICRRQSMLLDFHQQKLPSPVGPPVNLVSEFNRSDHGEEYIGVHAVGQILACEKACFALEPGDVKTSLVYVLVTESDRRRG